MRFSILVPVYNVEKYLSECLDSILNQSFTDFELICVNDGSTDTSAHILNSYSKIDSRIKVLTKNNEGLLWARRDAIKVASGDYILFIDSDDKYHDLDVLKVINDCLERHKDPDLLIFDRAELINEKVIYSCPHYFTNERIFEGKDLAELRYNFIVRNYLNGIFLKCIKTKILKADKTDYSVHNPQMAEDVTQSMYFFDKCQRVVFLPSYVYLYRNNNQSMTRVPLLFENLEKKMVRRLFYDLFNLIDKWDLKSYNNDVYEKFFKKAYLFYCGRVIDLCLNKKNKHIVKKILQYNWFDEGNLFLKNKEYVKIAKLKTSQRYISLGLIKRSSFNLRLGLMFYKIESAIVDLYRFLRHLDKEKK